MSELIFISSEDECPHVHDNCPCEECEFQFLCALNMVHVK